jgi:hypothetical protein
MDTVLFLNETALYLIENEQKAHTPSPQISFFNLFFINFETEH